MNKQQLAQKIWQSANKLRSKIGSNDIMSVMRQVGKSFVDKVRTILGLAPTFSPPDFAPQSASIRPAGALP